MSHTKIANKLIIGLNYPFNKYSKIQEYKIRIFYLYEKRYSERILNFQNKVFPIRESKMTNILFILFFIVLSAYLTFRFFYSKRNKRSIKRIKSFSHFIPSIEEKELNPDINTDDWDLHKKRLDKFRRSQYKGLTFFITSEDRIYYLSENGNKVYC